MLDELVVVSREVGGQLAALGVPIDLEVADKIGEPPRAPRWAKLVWDALKLEFIIQQKGRSSVTEAVQRMFDRCRDPEFKTRMIVVLACIEDEGERSQAAFEFAMEGLSTFCKCGHRLATIDEVARMRCDKCNWHDRHHDGGV